VKRKSDFNATGETVRDRSAVGSEIDYGSMTTEMLVDHFIDEAGLARFIDIDQTGIPFEDWDWRSIAIHLHGFTRGHLTFSPEFLRDLYAMQKARAA
jgi:hypothetical protein